MTESSRITDLRRRVQKDPTSIAFAQLAEECRRAGQVQEAVDICRSGLETHPGYLSARVTLGRGLVELGHLDEAQAELVRVLESAPENLAAIRGLAEIHHRRGEFGQALAQYRSALLLARNDPDLEETIADLSRQIEPAKPAASDGLTLEHMQHELLKHAPSRQRSPQSEERPASSRGTADSAVVAGPADFPPAAQVSRDSEPTQASVPSALSTDSAVVPPLEQTRNAVPSTGTTDSAIVVGPADFSPAAQVPWDSEPTQVSVPSALSTDSAVVPPLEQTRNAVTPAAAPAGVTLDGSPNDRAMRTVASLEEWLTAINVARAHRRA